MRRTRISLLLVLGMLAALLPIGAVVPAAATTGDLVITGVIDGPLSGGIPKAVEFYVVNDIADLGTYGFGSANNGGGSDGEEFTFPAVSATAGDFIYVASESVGFTDFFGFVPDYTSGAASINGDDAIELFNGGVVIDVFGDINVSGNGQPWEYTDGWAYRANGTGQDGSTFVLGNWTFSGPNALVGETTNATAAKPFPTGTYTTVSTATPLSGGGLATPDSVMAGGTSVLTVAVTPGDTPPSTEITVDVDLSPIGGGLAVPMVDDGTGGDSVPGDNIFSLTVTVPLTTADNTYVLTASIADFEGAEASADIELAVFSVIPDADLLLSGVVDGPLPGGLPKAVEFFVISDIADLSAYGFGSANNGGGSDGEEFTFPAVSATAGDFIYVASESVGFTSFFGFAPDYTSSAANINGDDAIELFNTGVVIDVFGDINVDGTGQPWEYADGWAYRVNETGPDGSTFVLDNWTFSGPDALDGETTNDTAAVPFPIGTYYDVAPPAMLLSGVVDGPLPGGLPKAVEFFVISDIADLSAYGFGSANNGGGSDGEEFTFPAVSATAGDFIYVASESTGFTSFFGFAPDYTSSAANINGDDAIELFNTGVVIDVFGDINVDGTGQPWEYADGWAYRVNETGPDGSTFVLDNWTFSGPDALDGETTNDTAAVPFPIGTYYDVAPPAVELSGIGSATPSVALAGETVLLTVDVTPADSPPSTGITVVADLSTIDGSATQSLLDDGMGGDAVAGDNTFSYEAIVGALTVADSYELGVEVDDVEGATASATIALAVVEVAAIHNIQGPGSSVAIVGPVAAEAIVTSLLRDLDALDGFLLQEEEIDYDADPLTSEGIRVECGSICPAELAVGDRVLVTGNAEEDFNMSQIDATAGSVIIRDVGVALPSAEPLELPARDGTDQELTFEEVEGMLVEFTDKLVVSEYFELARFGQVVLTVEERPFQFTHLNLPSVDGYDAFLAELATTRIVLDDDNNNQNDAISGAFDEPYFYPQPGLSTTNDFRGGDSITGLTGGMDWAFGEWRIKPTPEEFDYTFTRDNHRTASPDPIAGRLEVASFNVLNYFTTIDLGPDICGPSASLDCRGANSVAELDRQRVKTVAALAAIDADVVGLIELENNADESLSDLVDGLNAVVGDGTYDFVDTGTIGTDAIKVGLIYKTAAVGAIGGFAILDSTVDPTFIDTKNRPVLIQTFEESASGARFTVAVNHLKSKGSSCSDIGDPGTGDGQANCNLTRTSAATALVNYLATDPTGSGDSDFLIIGDLNAYAMEDPISAITSAGYTNLVDSFGGPEAYSYVFDGQLGYLDHALANASLLDQVKGVTEWHINADEINLFDYNDDIQDPAEASFERESAALPIFEENAFRSSDHDPVIIGLDLCEEIAPTIESITATPDVLWPANHKYVEVTTEVVASDNFDQDPTIELVSVVSSESDNGVGDGNTVDDIVIVDDFTFKLRAERSGSGEGRTYTITYRVTDECGNAVTDSVMVFVPLNRRGGR